MCFHFISVEIAIGIASPTIGLKICVTTAGIMKYKSIIKKKKRKKHDKIVSFAKYQCNRIKFLISKILIDSKISHHEFILINNVLKEFDDIKEEIKRSKDK